MSTPYNHLTRKASICADSTCESVVVSGVGDLNGVYTLDEDDGDSLRPSFERVTGVEIFNIYDRNGKWGLFDSSSYAYMVRRSLVF